MDSFKVSKLAMSLFNKVYGNGFHCMTYHDIVHNRHRGCIKVPAHEGMLLVVSGSAAMPLAGSCYMH
jgi:hypothetical protein